MGENASSPQHEDTAETRATHRAGTSRLASAAFVLLVLASASLTLLRSAYFRVERIEVRGTRELSSQDIVISCGLGSDENIFDVDTAMLAERIRANPRVDRVVVRRRLPSTIIVEIVERVPVAILPYAGYYVAVDEAGLAIGLVEGYKDSRLPLLTGLAVRSVRVGHPIEAPELPLAIGIARALPGDILEQVSEINFHASQGFSLYMQRGTRVALGSGNPEQLVGRIAVLEALLARLEQEGRQAGYIDVRFEKRPVVKDAR